MIFHVSMEFDDPKKLSEVIAEIWEGESRPIFDLVDGAYMAFCGYGNRHLSAIEVYPAGTDLVESEGDACFTGPKRAGRRPTATHVALSTRLDAEKVIEIGRREGWAAKCSPRIDGEGVTHFSVIEMWPDEFTLIEWLTPEMQRDYNKSVSQYNGLEEVEL